MTTSPWDAEVHLWMHSQRLGTRKTLLDVSLAVVSPSITHPVIRNRQVWPICFFLDLIWIYCMKEKCLRVIFKSPPTTWTTLAPECLAACSSGRGCIQKPFSFRVYLTIFEDAEPTPTPYSLSCIKYTHTRDAFLQLFSFTCRVYLQRFMLSPDNPCWLHWEAKRKSIAIINQQWFLTALSQVDLRTFWWKWYNLHFLLAYAYIFFPTC